MTHARKIVNAHPGRRSAAILATALLLSNAPLGFAQAGQTEQVIFSAENALYGAGYDIGRADGWFDNDLRSAVRAYQKANALAVSGKLDNPTLSALGVKAGSVQTVSGNALSSRAQSLKALELPSPATMPVARPEARKTIVEKAVAQKPIVEKPVVEKPVGLKRRSLKSRFWRKRLLPKWNQLRLPLRRLNRPQPKRLTKGSAKAPDRWSWLKCREPMLIQNRNLQPKPR